VLFLLWKRIFVGSHDVCLSYQVREHDLHLHRALRQHFQPNDEEYIDFEMFDHLVRKIVALANAFTGLETMQTVLPHQVDMLLEHQWPGASAGISKAAAKANMIKKMLGRGKKKSDTWESPFGSHFPNPQKKANYKFYHATYCPETGAYQDEIFSSEIDEDTEQSKEQKLWAAASRLQKARLLFSAMLCFCVFPPSLPPQGNMTRSLCLIFHLSSDQCDAA